MQNKVNRFYRKKGKILLLAFFVFYSPLFLLGARAATVADHTRTDINAIPESAINLAKSNLHIAYGHTSHGSQIPTGMRAMSLINSLFNGLDLREPWGFDLGNPNYTQWEASTRSYLSSHPEINVVIWSWCGQVSGATEATINTYLSLMTGLENDYPSVKFVYMTGHLDGTGEAGTLNQRNNQIRAYCAANNKILFDFADIESYNPDGAGFLALGANDACNYSGGNWASQWIMANPDHELTTIASSCGSCAHSERLNCVLKARAAWWLWARLAGWNECVESPSELSASADSLNQSIVLSWLDNSSNETGFLIQRQINGGAWDMAYASLPPGAVAYTDNGLAAGTYSYRVIARAACGDSASSHTASGIITAPVCVEAPSDLYATPDSILGQIVLSWQDNSSNEDGFIIQRQVDGGEWNVAYASLGSNISTFTDTGLSAGNYSYRVVANRDACGTSTPTDTVSCQIITPSLPDAPSDLSVAVSGCNVVLSWHDNSDNETGFIIERHREGQTFNQIAVTSANVTTYTDTCPLPLHTYTYRVRSHNEVGDSTWSGESSIYVPQAPVTPSTIRLQTTSQVDDAFLVPSNPTANYGNTPYLGIINPPFNFALKFILPSSLKDMKITDARVAFYGWNQTGFTGSLDLYRITADWSESTVTWNSPWTAPGGDLGQLLGSTPFSSGADHAYYAPIVITSVVQKWVDGDVSNQGMMLVHNSASRTGLKASEYGGGKSYLDVTYVPCQMDSDGDGDTDGRDLAIMAGTYDGGCINVMASHFGM